MDISESTLHITEMIALLGEQKQWYIKRPLINQAMSDLRTFLETLQSNIAKEDAVLVELALFEKILPYLKEKKRPKRSSKEVLDFVKDKLSELAKREKQTHPIMKATRPIICLLELLFFLGRVPSKLFSELTQQIRQLLSPYLIEGIKSKEQLIQVFFLKKKDIILFFSFSFFLYLF